MPRRKGDLLKQQKRLIATRLMQISLLVDDYLYQQKPMSVKSAFAYIKEISSYKDRCNQDVRSLQVIEKLTRCMKGIIHEQQEMNNECFEDVLDSPSQHTSEATNGFLSPVYSTIDDDLTQCLDIDKDITEIQENGMNNNKYVQINDVSNETDHFSGTYTTKGFTETSNNITQAEIINTNLEVLNICNGDQINQNNTIEPDFNIQNAILNLSIRDIEEALPPFSQDCSQSILNNYSDLHTDKVPLTPDYEEIITSTIHQKPATEKKSDIITKIVLPKKKPAKDRKNIASETSAIQKNNIAEGPGLIERENALKPVSKKSKAKNNDSNTKADKARTKQSKPSGVVKKQAKRQKTKCAKQLKTQTVSFDDKPSQYDQYECKNKIPLTNSTNSKELIAETTDTEPLKISKDLPIYNRVIVDDLSWIENIRFVREIPNEEYENFTENVFFWENYTLPSNWNDNDFDY